MNSSSAWFQNFLEGNAVIIEVTLLLLSLVSIVLFYFDIPIANLIIVRSVNLIAISYLFFASFDGKGYQITSIGYRIKGVGFSAAVLGAVFKLMDYPGQELMLKIGCFSMFIAALIWGFYNRKIWSKNLVALTFRISLITTLGLVLWFL